MSPHKTKRENFIRAVARLDAAVQDYQQYHMESIRDGMIQRFAFSFELAWKALKEYMAEQGVPDLQFPKQILQEAYAAGLIDDQTVWLEMHSGLMGCFCRCCNRWCSFSKVNNILRESENRLFGIAADFFLLRRKDSRPVL